MLLLLAVLMASTADANVLYQGSADLSASGGTIRAVHHHDWSTPATRKASVLRILDAASGREITSVSSPALTYLWVSPDGAYVVGLSTETHENPYQVLVLRMRDMAIARKAIWCTEAAALGDMYGCSTSAEGQVFWFNTKQPIIAIVDGATSVVVRVKPAQHLMCEYARALGLTPDQQAQYRCDNPPAFIEVSVPVGKA